MKKLFFSFIGSVGTLGISLGSYFGLSAKEDVINYFSEEINKNFSLPQPIYSHPKKENVTDSLKKNPSSLNKFHFYEWSYESEGATKPIYLVNRDGTLIKIDAKVHGQKLRWLNDGILIDSKNIWFGPRKIPLNDDNSRRREETLLTIWKEIGKIILNFDESELKQFSEWFNRSKDESKCEIIDVFMSCEDFKKFINYTEKDLKQIKDKFKIKIEELHKLASSKNEGEQFPTFEQIFGNNSVLYLEIFKGYESSIGVLINDWFKEEIQREKDKKDGKTEKEGKMNFINLIRKLSSGKEFLDICKENLKKNEKKIFGECFSTNKENIKENGDIEGEVKYLNLKVLDVVKAGNSAEYVKYGNNISYVPSSGGATQIIKNRQPRNSEKSKWEELPKELYDESWNQGFYKLYRWKSLIDKDCYYVGGNSNPLLWVLGFSPENLACKELYKTIFGTSNKPNKEKRWCLFRIPEETNAFLRETRVFNIFSLSRWKEGKQFWTYCENYGH